MTELSAYEFSTLRGGAFTLSRGLGRLWASPGASHGTAMRFTIPTGVEKEEQGNPVQDPAAAGAQALARRGKEDDPGPAANRQEETS